MTTNREFIDALFADATPWVCHFPNDPQQGRWAGAPLLNGEDVEWQHDNTYFSIMSIRDPKAGRGDTNFNALHVIMVDDVGTKVARDKLPGIAPTWVLRTSRKKDGTLNFQYGYALDKPCTDQPRAKRLIDHLTAQGYSDKGAGGVNRYARLPVGTNTKGGKEQPHELFSFDPAIRYSIEQLEEAFGVNVSDAVPSDNRPRLGIEHDPLLKALDARGMVKKKLADGKWDITCPWVEEHTRAIDDGTAYFEAHTNGYAGATFKCLHSHGADRTVKDVREFLNLMPAVAETFRCTDVGNARRLVARHGADMRYVVEAKQFIIWRNGRWEWDDDGEAMRRAKDAARSIDDEVRAAPDERRPALRAWATKSEGHDRLRSMIALAQSEHGVPIHVSELDRDPFLLGVLNGVVNLRSGGLRVPRREDLITKLAPVEYHPDATCPTFDCFLERILPSASVRAFVQRLAGYMLTGDISEQCFVTAYGTGANGKSTFVEAMHAMLGDYAMKTEMATLLHKDQDNVRNDLARLRGARLVSSVEIARSRRLNEQLIKELTGGDRITARFLFKEFFEFTPEFKLFIAVNHKPEVHGTDEAIWRRVMLVPFEQYIPPDERDKQLLHKLRTEMPGVLNWALAGCMEWQRGGLQPPEEVIAATQEYREEQDLLSNFLVSWTVIDAKAKASAGELHRAYVLWCRDNGEQAVKQKTFGMTLRERGLRAVNQRWAGKVQRVYDGIGLLEERQKELADRALERGRDKDEAQF
jgi:putative DNA primase/helicase